MNLHEKDKAADADRHEDPDGDVPAERDCEGAGQPDREVGGDSM